MIYPVDLLINGQKLATVADTDSVRHALAQMISNDYSQLPIIDAQKQLVGMISVLSVSRHYHQLGDQINLLDLKVVDCSEKPEVLPRDSDVLDALTVLNRSDSVVVVDGQFPVGIVTNADVVDFFRDIVEGLVLIEDMEVTLRQDIDEAYPSETDRDVALENAFRHLKKADGSWDISYDRLTLADYVNLIVNKHNWERFEARWEDKRLFQTYMDQVREIRNQLMHFRGRLDALQHVALKQAHDWLEGRRRRYVAMSQKVTLAPTNMTSQPLPASATGMLNDPQATDYSTSGKYGRLQDFLLALKMESDPDTRRTLSFQQIEEILGDELPNSALEHRAWWSNDSTSPLRQSMAWLRSGWEVTDVDFNSRQVTFRQTDNALRRVFWAELAERLQSERPSLDRNTKTYEKNYLYFDAGKPGFYYGWTIPSNRNELWTHLYIDTRHTVSEAAGRYFDQLHQDRTEIESQFVEPLEWDNQTNRYAVRIYAKHPFQINSTPEDLEAAKAWALEALLRLEESMNPRIFQLDHE